MNNNYIIKEKLKLFLFLLYDFKLKNNDEKEESNIPENIKEVMNDFYSSNSLKTFFKERGEELQKGANNIRIRIPLNKKENELSKKSKNILCFNQSFIVKPNLFYLCHNELRLFNDVICLKMFQFIKKIFIEGFKFKNQENKKNKFILASNFKENNKKKNKKTLKRKLSMDNLLLKLKNLKIPEKIILNKNKLNSSRMINNVNEKKNIELPYINNINVIKKETKRNQPQKIPLLYRKNYFKSYSLNDFHKIKKEKNNQSKENYDYTGIFKLYNVLRKQNLV